jgi:ssDNA-binding Zn-finger/Zn-ribbon topoisomerase 1
MQSMMSDDFAVRCTDCRFTWNTAAMAEGLRVLGVCPKCKGELEFGSREVANRDAPALDVTVGAAAPHLVLGIPRI